MTEADFGKPSLYEAMRVEPVPSSNESVVHSATETDEEGAIIIKQEQEYRIIRKVMLGLHKLDDLNDRLEELKRKKLWVERVMSAYFV